MSPDISAFPVPTGLSYFDYQLEGIQFLLEHEGALLADEMGVGKTVQAIGVINADPSISSVLIVCPATMKLVWKQELEKWLAKPFFFIAVIDSTWQPADIVLINYDRLHQYTKELSARVWDLVICDESHYLKTPTARRTKIATSLKAKRRIALSGTPLQNRPVELLPVLTWLNPTQWPKDKWHDFGLRYCNGLWNGFGWEYQGATNIEELGEVLRSTVMLRRTKAEVLPSLPAKLRSVVELAFDTNLRETVQAELLAFERWMELISGAPSYGESTEGRYNHTVKHLAKFRGERWDNLAVARHQTALAKVPLVTAFVRELFDGGSGKIVIFGHHRDVISQLAETLEEFGPVTLTGGMSPRERAAAIDQFHFDPETRLFIGNIVAGGIGITLAPASSHCIFAEISWVPAEMTQAEDRLHRVGTVSNVLVQHLVLEGSLDAIMIRRLIKKQEILAGILDSPVRL
jgi:SWI/SNF-related matrix-associated actin-dependent regulator 1 of chromatin subfamily A